MSPHTPTPWSSERSFGGFDIAGPNGEDLGYLNQTNGLDEPEWYPIEANAKFLVRAVNSHEALIAALKAVITYPAVIEVLAPLESLGSIRAQALAALALAEADQ